MTRYLLSIYKIQRKYTWFCNRTWWIINACQESVNYSSGFILKIEGQKISKTSPRNQSVYETFFLQRILLEKKIDQRILMRWYIEYSCYISFSLVRLLLTLNDIETCFLEMFPLFKRYTRLDECLLQISPSFVKWWNMI